MAKTKAEIWENIQAEVDTLVSSSKVNKGFKEALMSLLETHIAPKKGGGSINPPKLDEEDNIVEAYCRFHQRYEPAENMVISNEKSKGYCKASISIWNKANSTIKKLNSKASALLTEGQFEEAQQKAAEAAELSKAFNLPEFYDFDKDWENFNTTKPTKE